MPATLHDELARTAQEEGVSLNQLITGVLASSVGWRGSGTRPISAQPQSGISPRLTFAALAATMVVVLISAVAAIALLVAGWQAGL
jgi:HicB family